MYSSRIAVSTLCLSKKVSIPVSTPRLSSPENPEEIFIADSSQPNSGHLFLPAQSKVEAEDSSTILEEVKEDHERSLPSRLL
jgi:hypothetical protein